MSTTELRATGITDVGRTRERNEDSLYVGKNVFAVADGLGGHRGGDVASDLALESIRALDDTGSKKASSHVADAARRANKAVFDRSAKDEALKGMGTTLTTVAIHDGVAHVAHVGDSRCYLIRRGTITQLSRDHTLVAKMVADGKLTPVQAEQHPQRSVLTRALGAEREVDVQTQNVVLATGDRLLLCSDGLTGVLDEADLLQHAGTGADLDEICRGLVDEANARGGPDNITVILVDIESSPRDGVAPVPEVVAAASVRRVPVRALAWTGILLVASLTLVFGLRAWAGGSYYVGVESERVTIFRGLPVEVPFLIPTAVEESTEVSVEDLDSETIVRSLENGIRATSLEDARRIIREQIEPHIKPAARKTPKTPNADAGGG